MNNGKTALVCGAGGFIGSHLVKKLKREGYWVRGVDLKQPEFCGTYADSFMLYDLRNPSLCKKSLEVVGGFDEVYQLAADMGGMGFIHSEECEIMRNSALININMIHAAFQAGVKRYFFSSSACVYRDQEYAEKDLTEEEAYPAFPDNEYGWEKLYAERMAMTYGRNKGFEVRIARFQNCYGPEGTWNGGREKAPAALCRKVAEAEDGGSIDVWGDGKAVRAFTYVDDLVAGVFLLMHSDVKEPINIGRREYITVKELAQEVIHISGKNLEIKYIDGPVGVKARYFTNDKIKTIGWKSNISIGEGIRKTYNWILEQVFEEMK
jgi:nucleoside-diphosphate-sugar epimerase